MKRQAKNKYLMGWHSDFTHTSEIRNGMLHGIIG
jgi:hypothetical protein